MVMTTPAESTESAESAASTEAAARTSSPSGSDRRPADAPASHGEQRMTDSLDELDHWMAEQARRPPRAASSESPTAWTSSTVG